MSEETTMTNKQKLVFHLMEKGLSNEEVARALADVAEAAYEQFTTEAMAAFSDEDKKLIEAAENDVAADEEIKRLFSERAGKDATAYLDEIIEDHAGTYLHDSEQTSETSQ